MNESGRRTEDAIRALEETLLRHIPDDSRFESGVPDGTSSIIAFPMHEVANRKASRSSIVDELTKPLLDLNKPDPVDEAPSIASDDIVEEPTAPAEDDTDVMGSLRDLIDELREEENASLPAEAIEPATESEPTEMSGDEFESGVDDLVAELNALKDDMAKLYDIALDDAEEFPTPSESPDPSI